MPRHRCGGSIHFSGPGVIQSCPVDFEGGTPCIPSSLPAPALPPWELQRSPSAPLAGAPSPSPTLPEGVRVEAESAAHRSMLISVPNGVIPKFRFLGYENNGSGPQPIRMDGVWLRPDEDVANGHFVYLENVRSKSNAERTFYRVIVKDAYSGTNYAGTLHLVINGRETAIRPGAVFDAPATPHTPSLPAAVVPAAPLASTMPAVPAMPVAPAMPTAPVSPKGQTAPTGPAPQTVPTLLPTPAGLPVPKSPSPVLPAQRKEGHPTQEMGTKPPPPLPTIPDGPRTQLPPSLFAPTPPPAPPPPALPPSRPEEQEPILFAFLRRGFLEAGQTPEISPLGPCVNERVNRFLDSMKDKWGKFNQAPDGNHQLKVDRIDETHFVVSTHNIVRTEDGVESDALLIFLSPDSPPAGPRQWNVVQVRMVNDRWEEVPKSKQDLVARDGDLIQIRFERYLLEQGTFPLRSDPFLSRGYYQSGNEPVSNQASPALAERINRFLEANPGRSGLHHMPSDGPHSIEVEFIDQNHFLMVVSNEASPGSPEREISATLFTRRRDSQDWDITRVRWGEGEWRGDTVGKAAVDVAPGGVVAVRFDRYLLNPKYPLTKDEFSARGFYHAGNEPSWEFAGEARDAAISGRARELRGDDPRRVVELQSPAGSSLRVEFISQTQFVVRASQDGIPGARAGQEEATLYYLQYPNRWRTVRLRSENGTWRQSGGTDAGARRPENALDSLFESFLTAEVRSTASR